MLEYEKLQKIHEEACVQSSATLAKLISRQTVVDIINPQVKTVEDLAPAVGQNESVVIISLPVRYDIKGATLLMFSQKTAFQLSDLLIKRQAGMVKELSELDISALKEVGNIVSGNYFTAFSKLTGAKVIEGIPRFSSGLSKKTLDKTIEALTQKKEMTAMETEFNFAIPTLDSRFFKSYFLVLFDTEQLKMILDSLQEAVI